MHLALKTHAHVTRSGLKSTLTMTCGLSIRIFGTDYIFMTYFRQFILLAILIGIVTISNHHKNGNPYKDDPTSSKSQYEYNISK